MKNKDEVKDSLPELLDSLKDEIDTWQLDPYSGENIADHPHESSIRTGLYIFAIEIMLCETLEVTPGQVVPFAQVSERLQSTLQNTALQNRMNLYLALLRNKATIISYLG